VRTLAIDYGRRRHGLAVSDEDGIIARPLSALDRTRDEDEDVRRIAAIVTEVGASQIVVGLPLLPDGTEGTIAGEVRRFAERLRDALGVPVDSFDERLTTSEAERVLIEGGVRRRQRKSLRDGLAAVLILQGYLGRSRQADRERTDETA